MTRITEQTLQVVREAVAPRTEIYWNPLDNSGSVQFIVEDMIFENGEYIGLRPHGQYGRDAALREVVINRRMSVDLADILSRNIDVKDPETKEVITSIPGFMIMLAVKEVFDSVFAERLASQQAEEQDNQQSIP